MIQRNTEFETRRESKVSRAFFLCLAMLIACSIGCYEKNLAPPLEFSADDVEVLEEEINKMDWE